MPLSESIYVLNYRGTDLKVPDSAYNSKRVYYSLAAARASCRKMIKQINELFEKDPSYDHMYGKLRMEMFEVIEYNLTEGKRYLI